MIFYIRDAMSNYEMSDRSPVVNVATSCHVLTVLGHIAASLNDDTKSRIIGESLTYMKMCNVMYK